MCFMEGWGVDGHVGDDCSCFCIHLSPRWFDMVLRGQTTGETMTLIMVTTSALTVNVV